MHGNNILLGLLLLLLYINYNFLSNNLIITYKSQNICILTLYMMCFNPNWSQSIFSSSLCFNIISMSFSYVCHRQWLGHAFWSLVSLVCCQNAFLKDKTQQMAIFNEVVNQPAHLGRRQLWKYTFIFHEIIRGVLIALSDMSDQGAYICSHT